MWKVVKKNRNSIIINGNTRGFCKCYTKDATVKASLNTLGVFCFSRKEDAKAYAETWRGIVVKVKPLGRGSKPKKICHDPLSHRLARFYDFFNHPSPYRTMAPPRGTICYPAVKVLE